MARLNSLASVLEALELPEDGAQATSVFQARPDSDGVLAGATLGGPRTPGSVDDTAHGGRPGFRIWENARHQAEFYAAYAEMLEPGRRGQGRRRPRPPRRARHDGEAWVGQVYPEGHWVGPAALATSYRLAAQYAALVDAQWATRLAIRAAMAYVSSGLPFGLFLAAGLLDDDTLNDRVALRSIVEPFRNPDASDAIRHPVQQTYLLLAAGSRPWLRDPLRRTLMGAERRLTAHGLYSIGPQGVPLGDYVDLAAAMRYDDESAGASASGASVTEIARRLAGLQRTQAMALRAAQRNRFMWRRGASIIDLENVALSGLALRHRPWFRQLSSAVTRELEHDDELAELPVWTMREIENELPDIADSVTGIMREPERAWRSEEFREPLIETDPWTGETFVTREATQSPAPPTRADYPVARRGDANPGMRRDSGPDQESRERLAPPTTPYGGTVEYPQNLSDEDEGDDDDGPYLS